MRRILQRAVQKMKNRALVQTFEAWIEFWEMAKAEADEEAQRERIVARVLGKMMNKAISGAFDRWYEMVEEAKEMRVKINRALKKMMNRQLSQAFDRYDSPTPAFCCVSYFFFSFSLQRRSKSETLLPCPHLHPHK